MSSTKATIVPDRPESVDAYKIVVSKIFNQNCEAITQETVNMKVLNEDYAEPQFDHVIEETEDDEFELGQSYDGHPAKKLRCKKCGAMEFIVGIGCHFTAIKCKKCKYEICIHNG